MRFKVGDRVRPDVDDPKSSWARAEIGHWRGLVTSIPASGQITVEWEPATCYYASNGPRALIPMRRDGTTYNQVQFPLAHALTGLDQILELVP